jgi:hypothetical protein
VYHDVLVNARACQGILGYANVLYEMPSYANVYQEMPRHVNAC